MDFEDIIYTKENGIGLITLNRPQLLNAFSHKMGQEWILALDDAQEDPAVKVVVVTGTGRSFCSGGNPRDLLKLRYGRDEGDKANLDIESLARRVFQFNKPYIGAVNGPAVGGGMELTNMFDIRIASEQARFSMAFARMGETPSGGGCYFLPRIVGIARTLELCWTARMFNAQEALEMGYVSQVVPQDQLMDTVKEFTWPIVRGPSVAINLVRRLVWHGQEVDFNEAMEEHRVALDTILATEDAVEGPTAWIEKREPIFKGR
ncbi:MAG: enoyl-CoA hydratase-related protein [Dehalococcoidia bacterium]